MTSGTFKIISLAGGGPSIGVTRGPRPFQTIQLDGPVTDWAFKQVNDKLHSLSIGGYRYTGIVEGILVASAIGGQDQDWLIEYRQAQAAYTIASSSDPSMGWTLARSNDIDSPVLLQRLVSGSLPLSQLWRLQSATGG